MDKDARVVTGFLVLIFIMSFAFHVLYAEGKAYEWFVAQQEESHDMPHEGPREERHH